MKRGERHPCPYCGRSNDLLTEIYGGEVEATPAAGDFSICWGCRRVGIFTGQGWALRRPTLTERVAAFRDDRIRAALRAAAQIDPR